jgi:hypothetical protein
MRRLHLTERLCVPAVVAVVPLDLVVARIRLEEEDCTVLAEVRSRGSRFVRAYEARRND